MRIPRPLGSTELSKLYNNTNDEEHYQSLKQNITHHYIRNNFSYCGHYMNIETFAFTINESIINIQKHIGTYGRELSKLNDEMFNKDFIRVLGNFSLNFCLEDRSTAQQQLNLLLESQGGSYAPFISGEVNKAIKLMMDANTNTQSLLRTFMGSGQGNVMPFMAQEDNAQQGNGITADEAIMILKENKVTPLLENTNQIANLHTEYNIGNMPEVNALKQIGMDSSKEGLGINAIGDSQLVNHNNRREEEYGIIDNDEV